MTKYLITYLIKYLIKYLIEYLIKYLIKYLITYLIKYLIEYWGVAAPGCRLGQEAATGCWLGGWRHLEGPGCKKWCHSQPKCNFHARSI